MPMSIRAPAAAVLAALLAGCAAVGPNFTRPAAPAVKSYAMAGDPTAAGVALAPAARTAGPWWRELGSRRLDAVMAEAFAGNQTVAAALADLDRAREQARASHGALAPVVSASASGEEQHINITSLGFSGFPNPTVGLLSVGGQVSYDFDFFGKKRRQAEAARAVAEEQGFRADAAYLSLTGQVALAAVRIAAIRAQIDAMNTILADDHANYVLSKRAEAAGGEAASSVTGPRAQIAADQALLPPLAQELSQARHNLALLVGKSPAEWTAPAFDMGDFHASAAVPVELPSQLVRRRPDILAAEAQLHADTAEVGVATADLYPDITLAAGWAQTAQTPGALFGYGASGWNFGGALAAPLLNGGRLRAQKRAAEAQARASLADYRQTVLAAFGQVADVLAALAHDDQRASALEASDAAAESALHDARSAYTLGGGPYADIVTAQRQVDQARLGLVEARAQKLMDEIELYAATAADWRADGGKHA